MLALAREIRDAIYDEAITCYEGNEQPELTKVNRQLRAETMRKYYETHPFRFDFVMGSVGSRHEYEKWATKLGDENAALVRHLEFRVKRSDATSPIYNGRNDTTIFVVELKNGELKCRMMKPEDDDICLSLHRFQCHLKAIDDRVENGKRGVKELLSIEKGVPGIALMKRPVSAEDE